MALQHGVFLVPTSDLSRLSEIIAGYPSMSLAEALGGLGGPPVPSAWGTLNAGAEQRGAEL